MGEKEYWAGRLWVYQADITNGAGGAGNHSYTVIPGAGCEMEVLYGELFNGDVSNRTGSIVMEDNSTNRLVSILATTINAAARQSFPTAIVQASAGSGAAAGPRFILAGAMRLVATVAAVTLSENTALGLVCRVRGGVPSVAEAGASTPTINVNTEQVF